MAFSILLAEDEAPLREAAKQKLESAGFDVYAAKDGEEGYLLFKGNKIDVCFIDVLMPIVNGNQLVRLIRKRNKNVPIYLFTNFSDKDIYHEALEAGIQGIIVKANTPLSVLIEFCHKLENGLDVEDMLYHNGDA